MRWIALFALVPFVFGAVPKCAKTEITQQRTIETQGLKFNFTISQCAGAKKHRPFTDAQIRTGDIAKRTLDTSLDFEKRQVGQCTLPTPNCICGVGCTDTSCFGPRGPIHQSDCAQLALGLIQTAGTFLIQPGQYAGVTYKSCTYVVYNNEETNLQEYCYNVLGNVGFSNLNLGCANREGYCGGGTLLGVSRFYVEQISTAII